MNAAANPDSFAFIPTGDLIAILDRIEAVLLARFGVPRDRSTVTGSRSLRLNA